MPCAFCYNLSQARNLLRNVYGVVSVTPRKREAYRNFQLGKSVHQIGLIMNIAQPTVEVYVLDYLLASTSDTEDYQKLYHHFSLKRGEYESVIRALDYLRKQNMKITLSEIKKQNDALSYNKIKFILIILIKGVKLHISQD